MATPRWAAPFLFSLLFGLFLRLLRPPAHAYRHLALPAGANLSCGGVLDSDPEALERARLYSLRRRRPVTEMDYLRLARDCSSFVGGRRYLTAPLSRRERSFPLAYSMVIHESVEMFERLLRAVYAPQNIYCVHVDRKSPGHLHAAVRAVAACFPNVFVAARLESVTYASWSRVQADLNCMEELLAAPVAWRYLINVCGKDFPLGSNRETVEALWAMNGTNVVDSYVPPSFKAARWKFHHEVGDYVRRTSQLKAPPPIRGRMFVGSAYVMVTRDFVRYLFIDPEVRAFFEWSRDTYSPDEHIWATLQGLPGAPGSLPGRLLPHPGSPNKLSRAVKWSFLGGDVARGAAYPPCAGRYRHMVCVFGAGDLAWLVHQSPLFANKFDPEVSDAAVRCLEEWVRDRALQGAGIRP
ncbi:beta-1,3-galactosyl-O-glycosyl-glycoprotein beta-1,6-N-acetylglucosaminyltransferase 3-like [Narcine bancroftii]|uniref:beta-1,3-galactosyl-O-glycosyl-glycoprotein beta-1,6-N-acetylglucosaminyltransferase 3-like n=1 Tax=Narcine bancroftii TaxID=1343680 RepID=UPI00383206B5